MINLKKEKPILIIYSNWDSLIFLVNFVFLLLTIIAVRNLWTNSRNINIFILLGCISLYIVFLIFSIWLSQASIVFKKEKIIFWKSCIEFVNHSKFEYNQIKEISQKIKNVGKHQVSDFFIDGKYIGQEFEDLEYLKYFLRRNEDSKHIRFLKLILSMAFLLPKKL
jgi:hypothetical protein